MRKIYTKTGDQGTTSLVGGKRVSKQNPLLDAYGTIDELNASIGLILAEDASPFLTVIQQRLFVVGGMLATETGLWAQYWQPDKLNGYTGELEAEIDKMSEDLPALNSFLLPQGSRLIAQVHLTRTICRRAERKISCLVSENSAFLPVLQFVNRLSDYFFILARFYHKKSGISETYCELDK